MTHDSATSSTPDAGSASKVVEQLGLACQGHRQVLAIDGASGSGKSTLAASLAAASTTQTAVVHTDDIAWHLSFFDWSTQIIEGVLTPFRNGDAVRYRPPGWKKVGRGGHILVPASTQLLIIEGTGAGREELVSWTDALIWVQVDPDVARSRVLERDLRTGVNGATPEQAEAFFEEWMAQETTFFARHRPWERADAVILS